MRKVAQLYYKYGTMNSGKTIEILKVAHNYEEQGKPVVIMTSALDTRDAFGVVSSRIGMRREAVAIDDEMDIFAFIEKIERILKTRSVSGWDEARQGQDSPSQVLSMYTDDDCASGNGATTGNGLLL